jgi:recombination protein RecA
MKIGVMFGSPETTTGGNALKFYASVRLDVRRIGALKGDGDVVLGNRTRVKVVKNKVAPPFRECEFDIIFNEGISQLGEIVDMGVEKGVIDKMGSWFSFRGERLGQGREGAKQFLREHPEVASELRGLILSAVGVGGVPNTELATATSTKVAVTKTDSSKSEDGSSKSAMDEKIAKVAKKKGELNGAAAHS